MRWICKTITCLHSSVAIHPVSIFVFSLHLHFIVSNRASTVATRVSVCVCHVLLWCWLGCFRVQVFAYYSPAVGVTIGETIMHAATAGEWTVYYTKSIPALNRERTQHPANTVYVQSGCNTRAPVTHHKFRGTHKQTPLILHMYTYVRLLRGVWVSESRTLSISRPAIGHVVVHHFWCQMVCRFDSILAPRIMGFRQRLDLTTTKCVCLWQARS